MFFSKKIKLPIDRQFNNYSNSIQNTAAQILTPIRLDRWVSSQMLLSLSISCISFNWKYIFTP